VKPTARSWKARAESKPKEERHSNKQAFMYLYIFCDAGDTGKSTKTSPKHGNALYENKKPYNIQV
jgi:hypothetical protein